MTKIKKCNCEHKMQDEMLGKGMRVMNLTTKGNVDIKVWRCTVCGKESK